MTVGGIITWWATAWRWVKWIVRWVVFHTGPAGQWLLWTSLGGATTWAIWKGYLGYLVSGIGAVREWLEAISAAGSTVPNSTATASGWWGVAALLAWLARFDYILIVCGWLIAWVVALLILRIIRIVFGFFVG